LISERKQIDLWLKQFGIKEEIRKETILGRRKHKRDVYG